MKYLQGLVLVCALFIIAGCSSSDKSPATPSGVDNVDISTAFNPDCIADFRMDDTNWKPAFTGHFIPDSSGGFELVEDIQAKANIDVTSLILGAGAFSYEITNINGNEFEIELTIENPTSMIAYDVRLIFNDIGPSKIINPDSYTKLFSQQISPYFCFGKSDPDRMFPIGPGVSDSRNMFLEYNGGYPGFTIAISMPDVCEEPFEIANPAVIGQLNDIDGGWANIFCNVLDHQIDIEYVGADLSLFTGDYELLIADPYDPDKFEVYFENDLLAPAGIYPTWIAAKSLGSPLLCYNLVQIEVDGGLDPPVVTITYPDEDPFDTPARYVDIIGTIDNFTGSEATMEVNGNPQTIGVFMNTFDEVAVLQAGENFIKVSAEGPGGIGSDTITINSSAEAADIWVQLTWDKDDTDVDLYITEPGPSNFTLWYMEEVSPDTGAEIDVDDIDGYGPEHYYLSVNQGHILYTGIYEVDVHYYSDHGNGPTTAKIIVYKGGAYFGEWTHYMDYSDSIEDGPENRRTGLQSWWDSVVDIEII